MNSEKEIVSITSLEPVEQRLEQWKTLDINTAISLAHEYRITFIHACENTASIEELDAVCDRFNTHIFPAGKGPHVIVGNTLSLSYTKEIIRLIHEAQEIDDHETLCQIQASFKYQYALWTETKPNTSATQFYRSEWNQITSALDDAFRTSTVIDISTAKTQKDTQQQVQEVLT